MLIIKYVKNILRYFKHLYLQITALTLYICAKEEGTIGKKLGITNIIIEVTTERIQLLIWNPFKGSLYS